MIPLGLVAEPYPMIPCVRRMSSNDMMPWEAGGGGGGVNRHD